jgi:uncharacterized protein YggT (Ycf19 family)
VRVYSLFCQLNEGLGIFKSIFSVYLNQRLKIVRRTCLVLFGFDFSFLLSDLKLKLVNLLLNLICFLISFRECQICGLLRVNILVDL